jgi:Carboxypeptidase regulatory-like domain
VRKPTNSFSLLQVAMVVSALGCNQGSLPGTVPVSGKVTYKGQPVPHATVTFLGEGDTRTAVAVTDASGTYQLQTLDNRGALPGKYTVLVSRTEATASSDQPVSMDEAAKNRGKAIEPKQLLPAKYADPAKTPLTAEVHRGKTNSFDFPLTD